MDSYEVDLKECLSGLFADLRRYLLLRRNDYQDWNGE